MVMLEKVYQLDFKISDRLRMDNDQTKHWKAVTFIAHSGDSWFWLAGLILVWLFSQPLHRISAFLILAIILLAGIVMGIKLFVRRRRPPGEWGAVYRNTDPHSFPSGHAARACMLALFAVQLGPVWLAILMVAWALMVSLSRIITGMHYFSDILAGILLGITSGQIILLARPLMEGLLPFIFH
jgi:membrane-associated phospholipid phosphatase